MQRSAADGEPVVFFGTDAMIGVAHGQVLGLENMFAPDSFARAQAESSCAASTCKTGGEGKVLAAYKGGDGRTAVLLGLRTPSLEMREEGLTLVGNGLELRGDFARMLPRLGPGRLNKELLVRAARIKGVEGVPTAVDATAGLGEDSMLLAAAGFCVRMYERDAMLAALLRDALQRAREVPELRDAVGRLDLVEGDSMEGLRGLEFRPDVVFLDPMFPQRKKSAAVKKKLQLLQQLESPCKDEAAFVEAALAAHPRKVVIKRPAKGPWLAGIKPSYSLQGKAIRYDVLV